MLQGLGEFGYVNAVLLFCGLVFVHELGHFLVARWNKVTVEVFSIGFGPELIGWHDRYGTRWRIAALPLGGYVKMLGEEASALEAGAKPLNQTAQPGEMASARYSFVDRSRWARAAIVAAGPIANLLFAALLYSASFALFGMAQPGNLREQGLGVVVEGSAADLAGLRSADKILSVNGNAIVEFDDLVKIVRQSDGKPITFSVEREGETKPMTIDVKPRPIGTGNDGKPTYQLGLGQPFPSYQKVGLAEAAIGGVKETYNVSVAIIVALGQTVIGARGTDDLGGPIKIFQMSKEISRFGLASFISFAAVLSINLGLINLLPIPVLDGGHLLFLGLEGLRGGKPVNEKMREWGMRLGLALVMGLMIFVTIKDILSLFTKAN